MINNENRSLSEILQSTSEVLFPDDMGTREIEIHSTDRAGETPLHILVRRRDLFGATVLLDAGAHVDAIGDMGETALHIAVAQNEPEMVELLLKVGSNRKIKSEFGKTAEAIANGIGGKVAKLFKKYKA